VRSFLSGCHARGGSRPLPRPILGHLQLESLFDHQFDHHRATSEEGGGETIQITA
jgi:hypothetical protein